MHLTSLFVSKLGCLLRDVWFLLDFTLWIIHVEEACSVFMIKSNELDSVDIEVLEMSEKLLVVSLVEIEFAVFSIQTEFANIYMVIYWLICCFITLNKERLWILNTFCITIYL